MLTQNAQKHVAYYSTLVAMHEEFMDQGIKLYIIFPGLVREKLRPKIVSPEKTHIYLSNSGSESGDIGN